MADERLIMIADDDPDIREVVRILLESEGFRIVEAVDGDDAISKIDPAIDLYILDVMMPGKSGYQVCRAIRAASTAPILFLTAKSQDGDKSMGFSSGGDDYLPKPFSYTELTARVKALLRRYYVYRGKESEESKEKIVIRDLVIDRQTCEVRLAGAEVQLTDIEYRMLLLMAENRRKVFSAQNLYESIWNEPYFYSCNNTIMVHIRNLRRKIEPDPDNPQYIKTVWGKGYRID
ncbi:MAG: response regulator transcription factor [Eubacteriales bacterium]|nr:response regulator transcription factor [Clostridiales bacterium]MDY2770312.1 response regulator transcription factor [Eubacteriales bacterium]